MQKQVSKIIVILVFLVILLPSSVKALSVLTVQDCFVRGEIVDSELRESLEVSELYISRPESLALNVLIFETERRKSNWNWLEWFGVDLDYGYDRTCEELYPVKEEALIFVPTSITSEEEDFAEGKIIKGIVVNSYFETFALLSEEEERKIYFIKIALSVFAGLTAIIVLTLIHRKRRRFIS